MKKIGLTLLILGIGVIAWDAFAPKESKIISPLVKRFSGSQNTLNPERVYAEYSFDSLSQKKYEGSQIKLEREILKEEKYTSWVFSYLSDGQKVTGQLNLPKKTGKSPVVIMLRGYADKEIYFTGLGTRKAAGVLAENGFITFAPDFLGFGGSDSETTDVLLNRFKRPVTVLNLIASLNNFPQADLNHVFLWAHSNGGQIALSVLEISGFNYPATLWAPVTLGFPECVLDYIDQENLTPEAQKVLSAVNDFETTYDPKIFSTDNYYQKINAPIQIHQGGADPWVPAEWQEDLIKELNKLKKEVTYYYYPQADHNLEPSWDTVVQKDLEFFNRFLN
ncbi:dienelactone hydrolase family protein [Candidatus Shapirobacteria bacterium]|nr:dienelactone hydrolase family protein [Candidatus Shapirobacteria bacterium]